MKRFIILFVICFIFCTVLIFSMSCGKSDKTFTIETIDGVNYVHNRAPLWGDTTKVALEFVQKIGDLETVDENYQLYRPYDIVSDTNENVFILDRGNRRIQKYDKNGKYLATIGRSGQGPGEFTDPVSLEIDSKENLYVRNLGQFHIQVITNVGKEIKRITLPFGIGRSHVTNAGDIVFQSDFRKMENVENWVQRAHILSLCNQEGNILKEFGKLTDYGDDGLTRHGNNFSFIIDINDNIYIAFSQQNRIEKYSPEGEIVFRADRPLNYKLKHEMKTIKLPFEEETESITVPEFRRVSNNIRVDHHNRIWIQTYKKQEEEGDKPFDLFEFDIFDNDGIFLGKIPIPQNFNKMRIFQDRLYLIDTYEEMCVYEYKIVEK